MRRSRNRNVIRNRPKSRSKMRRTINRSRILVSSLPKRNRTKKNKNNRKYMKGGSKSGSSNIHSSDECNPPPKTSEYYVEQWENLGLDKPEDGSRYYAWQLPLFFRDWFAKTYKDTISPPDESGKACWGTFDMDFDPGFTLNKK